MISQPRLRALTLALTQGRAAPCGVLTNSPVSAHTCARARRELKNATRASTKVSWHSESGGSGARRRRDRQIARSVLSPLPPCWQRELWLGRARSGALRTLWLSNRPRPSGAGARGGGHGRHTPAIGHSRAGTALPSQTQPRARPVARVRKAASCLKSAPRLCRSLTENRADRPATFFEP